MKTIRILCVCAVIMSLLLSCNHDENGFDPSPFRKVMLTAVSDESRTFLDGNAVKWVDEDRIALVFSDPSASRVAELSAEIEGNAPVSSAVFTGVLDEVVSVAGGYDDNGLAVYPSVAVNESGKIDFTLPDIQVSDPKFFSENNLSSAAVSLSDIEEDGKAYSCFRNALSILRFTLSSEVTSFSLTGTCPMAGKAPLEVIYSNDDSNGRLRLLENGRWTDPENTVILQPESGAESFTDGQICNLLVWPGAHSSLTLKVTYGDGRVYEKTSSGSFTLEPSRFYTLDFDPDSEVLLSYLQERVGTIEDVLKDMDDSLDEMGGVLSQIQSVVTVSEYTGNMATARYSVFSSSKIKDCISISYLVRPAAMASETVDKCTDVMSARVICRSNEGEVQSVQLPVVEAVLADPDAGLITVSYDASQLPDRFYDGSVEAELALHVSDGTTDVISDFITLVPKLGPGVDIRRVKDIPVLKEATVSVPFSYSLVSDDGKVAVSGEGIDEDKISLVYYEASRTGYLSVRFGDEDLSAVKVYLHIYSGDEEFVQLLTFVDGGVFEVEDNGAVDYVGGEVVQTVTANSFGSYSSILSGGGDWVTSYGSGIYSVAPNTGMAQRSAEVVYNISNGNVAENGSIVYYKYVPIVQYGTSVPLQREYYADGQKLVLNAASPSYTPLNLVILGDGYQKKDLSAGGRFERNARSVMGNFFAVEPFKSFDDRFNVYMVSYESQDEGPDLMSDNIEWNTYFGTEYKGGGNTYVNCRGGNYDKVTDVVRSVLGLSSDEAYYRTIVILLVNTSENLGSTAYPQRTTIDASVTGDGFASFAIAMLASGSTGTGGLVRHEAGGHAFGRLADEYVSGKGEADASVASELESWHLKGFYRNVCTDMTYWNEFSGLEGYESVGYYEGAWSYTKGVYRPTASSIMLNNNGQFNAPSRRAIYERIIRQTEGYDAYSFAGFLTYDKVNTGN